MTGKNVSGKAERPQRFEDSLKRLETIVAEMEGGKLSLEDMIARFEEGQALIAFCGQKLNEVERKIEILVKKGNAVAAEPFSEEVSEGAAEEPADGKSPF